MDARVLIPVAVAVIVAVVAFALILVARSRHTGSEARTAGTGAGEAGLRKRLSRTRSAIGGRLRGLLRSGMMDDGFWVELEEVLISADVGVGTAASVVGEVRGRKPEDGEAARRMLEEALVDRLSGRERSLRLEGRPAVILVVGVNGSGKTTSIAKIAGLLGEDGRTSVLAAADTFRAAADEQLRSWADRVGVRVVSGTSGSDPASVAFDAYRVAAGEGVDVCIVDTAGRLHSKANLMDELGKVARVLRREAGTIGEVLLVLDGTTGQNGIGQAKSFTEKVGVTGIVITKLDGTSRGGVAIAVEEDLGVPVKFIGVGEDIHDLIPFEPAEFVEALLEP